MTKTRPDDPVLAAALTWLIRSAPGWFRPNANASGPPEAEPIHRTLRGWWADRVAATIPAGASLPEAARAVARAQRAHVVTQRQFSGVEIRDDIGDDALHASLFARVVCGLTNCEGLAALTADALARRGFPCWIVETARHDGGSHSLLVGAHDGGWCMIDAWSDEPVFWSSAFDRAAFEAEAGERIRSLGEPLAGVPRVEDLARAGEPVWVRGLFPAQVYGSARAKRLGRLRRGRLHDAPGAYDACVFAAEDAGEMGPPADGWQAFLELRRDHLFGRLASPADAYEAYLSERRIGGLTAALVSALRDAAARF